MESQKAQTEMSSSGYSSRSNQFFKSGVHNYNPLAEENASLKEKLKKLKAYKEAKEKGGAKALKELNKKTAEKR